MITITYSQIAAYLKCKKLWKYAYVDQLAPRVDAPALQLGTLVHCYFEGALGVVADNPDAHGQHYAARKYAEYVDSRKMFEEEIEHYKNLLDKAINIGQRAYENFIKHYEILSPDHVEHKFKIPITDNVVFVGKVDVVVIDKRNGSKWVLDHKVRKSFQSEENEELNLQNAIYQSALAKQGIETVGTIAHQIFNDLPKVPELTQKGTMSKANIKTDWETYKSALTACNLPTEDYTDMKSKLEEQVFFNFLKAYRNPQELKNIWDEIVIPSINGIVMETEFTRSMSVWNCGNCQFKELCLEELRGNDTSYLLKHNFTRNAYMDQYTEEEE